MALKSLSLMMMISTLMVAAASLDGVSALFGGRKALAPAPSGPVALPPGFDFGFIPLDKNDPKVIELAMYAIEQQNKLNKSNLVFTAVFEALYTESEKGQIYGMIVAATNEKKQLNGYEVKVLVQNEENKSINQFSQL